MRYDYSAYICVCFLLELKVLLIKHFARKISASNRLGWGVKSSFIFFLSYFFLRGKAQQIYIVYTKSLRVII